MALPQNLKMVNAYTAGTPQTQAGAVVLDVGAVGHRVTTVTVIADGVKLPKAINGRIVFVANAAANSLNVYPDKGDAVNAVAVDGAYALAGTKTAMFICFVDGTWTTILTA